VLDTVGWVIWPVKIVPDMTYNVFGGTLNPTTTTTSDSQLHWYLQPNHNQIQVIHKKSTVWQTYYVLNVTYTKLLCSVYWKFTTSFLCCQCSPVALPLSALCIALWHWYSGEGEGTREGTLSSVCRERTSVAGESDDCGQEARRSWTPHLNATGWSVIIHCQRYRMVSNHLLCYRVVSNVMLQSLSSVVNCLHVTWWTTCFRAVRFVDLLLLLPSKDIWRCCI